MKIIGGFARFSNKSVIVIIVIFVFLLCQVEVQGLRHLNQGRVLFPKFVSTVQNFIPGKHQLSHDKIDGYATTQAVYSGPSKKGGGH